MNDKKWEILIWLPEELGQQEAFLRKAVEGSDIRICTLHRTDIHQENWTKKYDIDPKRSLMIVGTEETLILAEEAKIPTLPYRAPDGPGWRFLGEPYVMEGFEEVDERFLRRRFQRYYGIPWIIGETRRCLIRELSMEDVPALFALYEKPHVTDHMEKLYPRDQEIEYQRQYIDKVYGYYEFGMWLVFEKDTGKLIGRAGLEPRGYPADGRGEITESEEVSVIELGYLIDPDYQRKGYATEVCRKIIQIAWEEYEAKSLHCLIRPENLPSVRLAEKLGFTNIGNMHMDRQKFRHYILYGDSCNLKKKLI